MQIETTVRGSRDALRELRKRGGAVGLVPTMGALHAGHLSLVRVARQRSDILVVSIFVNPTQFGPNEDLARYPRTFEQDRALLEAEGVDLLFAPAIRDMYAPGAGTFVDVEELSERLDGVSRPGHFRGVATVVAKLFNIIAPDKAFFGQKDAAQVAVLRKMVRDLNFDLELVICPVVREDDGLALSSRNRYLSPEDRKKALALSRTLEAMRALYASGERRSETLVAAGQRVVASEPGVRLDYLSVVHPETLEPVALASAGTLVAIAAFVGTTRLIDNLLL